jgi:hypothetical protein
MIERFRRAPALEKTTWIAFVLLAIFAIVAFARQWPPPSGWFGWRTEITSEWLGWTGLIGLGFTLVQLLITKGAARASEMAVARAMATIETLNTAMEIMQYAIDAFAIPNFQDAATNCDRGLATLSRVRAHYGRLPQTERIRVDNAWDQLGSASSAARRGQQGHLEQVRIEAVIQTLRARKVELMRTLHALRSAKPEAEQ